MRFALIATFALAAGTAGAGPYDGVFRPNYDFAKSWDCEAIGTQGGALAVNGRVFHGIGHNCALTDPVEVRDMNATLYDAECSGEGQDYRERLMLMEHEFGIYA